MLFSRVEAGLNRGMVSALQSLSVGAVQGRKENRGSNAGCRLGVCYVVKQEFACCSVGSVVRFLHQEESGQLWFRRETHRRAEWIGVEPMG